MNHDIIPWIQIPTIDLKRASTFYKNVFNIETFFENLNGIPHAVFVENHRGVKPINGALIEVTAGEKLGRGPVLFFEATGQFAIILELIEANGGEILIPKTLIKRKTSEGFSDIPDTYVDNRPGYYARFKDSEGNLMGLYGSN